jgi:hypothetical protein
MVNWQLTATTILCDSCGKEVTIFIYKDGQVRCTGASLASGDDKKTVISACNAETCKQVAEYKSKLEAEEQVG